MSTPPPVLPERQKTKRGLVIGVIAAAAVLIVAGVFLVPRLVSSSTNADGLTTVKIGITDVSQPQWQILADTLRNEGIKLETVNFAEYSLPNPALANGEIDVNAFQHLDFLSNHNLATGDNLQPIASTLVVPLPLYSKKYGSVAEIPQGGQVAIPNDPSNQGRAINVLKAAGLVTLTGDPTVPTPADIDKASSRVSVIPVDAAQTPAALQSAAGAVINDTYSHNAGIDPHSAIFSADPSDQINLPYVNVIVARAADIDNPTYQKVADAFHTKPVEDAVVTSSGGSAVIVNTPGAELREQLKSLEDKKRAAK